MLRATEKHLRLLSAPERLTSPFSEQLNTETKTQTSQIKPVSFDSFNM